MNADFTAEELAFQAEVREFLANEFPAELKQKVDKRIRLSKDEIVGWQKVLYKKGVDGTQLAQGIRRHRVDAYAEIHFQHGNGPCRRPRAYAFRRDHGRACDHGLRHRRAEATFSARHS